MSDTSTAQTAAPADADSGSFLFLRKFLKHGTRVASVAPSSRALANAMVRHLDSSKPQTLVELGAGTGAVTRMIAEKMHPESTLYAVEIDPDFAAVLRKDVPQAKVLQCDVKDLPQQLASHGVDHVDHFFSCLPTPSLPKSVNKAIYECFTQVSPADTMFSQITIMPWVFWPMYRKVFKEVQFNLVVANFPPAGAYHCRGLKDNYFIPGK